MSRNESDNMLAGLERKIEALLFASDAPLSVGRLSALTDTPSAASIRSAVSSLNTFYKDSTRSFAIVEVAGGYQVTTLPEFATVVSRLFKHRRKARLSQAALETLAIVAYKQPIGRLEIEAIRGVNCDGVISTLLDRELVTVSGRGDGIGRPYLYSTTRQFLEYLGLKDYRDLPSIEELEKSIELADLAATRNVGGGVDGRFESPSAVHAGETSREETEPPNRE